MLTLGDVRAIIEKGEEIAEKKLRGKIIEREIESKIFEDFKRKSLLIYGLRGIGKTVILSKLLKELNNAYLIPVDYLVGYYRSNIIEFIKVFRDHFPRNSILLFDEVHYDREFSLALKLICDYEGYKFIATGSNAIKILAGPDLSRRVKKIEVLPFSFSEYLILRDKISWDEIGEIRRKVRDFLDCKIKEINYRIAERHLKEYLKIGGFPEAVEEGVEKIKDILDMMILKDIMPLKIVDESTVKRILSYLAVSFLPSERSIVLGLPKVKFYRLLDVLEKSGLIFPVFPYDFSIKKILRRGVKYYFSSSSLIYSILFEMRKDIDFGFLLENEVANVLRKIFGKVFYIKNEIDFFSGDKLFEVKWGKKVCKKKNVITISGLDTKKDRYTVISKDLFLLL